MMAPNRPGACGSMRGRSKAMRRVPSAKASLRSWVTMITVMPQSRQSGLISACICARVPGSSAPNGSSSSSTRGRRAIAWAIARRCCMPPESALGYLSRCAASPTSSIRLSLSSIAARRAAPVRRDRQRLPANSKRDQHIAQHGQMREHRIALEHDAAIRPGLVRHRRAVEQQRPARRPLLSEHHAQECVLPQPEGPTIETKAPDAIWILIRSNTIWSPYSTQTSRTVIALIGAPAICRPTGTPRATARRARSP